MFFRSPNPEPKAEYAVLAPLGEKKDPFQPFPFAGMSRRKETYRPSSIWMAWYHPIPLLGAPHPTRTTSACPALAPPPALSSDSGVTSAGLALSMPDATRSAAVSTSVFARKRLRNGLGKAWSDDDGAGARWWDGTNAEVDARRADAVTIDFMVR